MGKPNYRVLVAFDSQRAVFSARVPELEHLSGDGPTRKDAIARLEEEIDAQLANMLSQGSTPPHAVDEEEFSGDVQAKVSRGLHRDLAYLARSEGVELDQIISELLSAALSLRQGGRSNGRSARNPNQQVSEPVHADDIGNRVDGNRGGSHADGNRSDGGRRFGRGGGYSPQILDDRANFIEYVRNQEAGQAGRGGGGGGGGRSGGGGGGGGHQGGHPGTHQGTQNNNDNRRRRRGGGGGGGPQQGGREGGRMHGQGGRGPGGGGAPGAHQGRGPHGASSTQSASQGASPAPAPTHAPAHAAGPAVSRPESGE